jgi:Uma2 family endonuclease
MATLTQLGPADQGRIMTFDEFMAADYCEGYRYELIDGKLQVHTTPNLPHERLDVWLFKKLDRYSSECPEVVNLVLCRGRVIVPDRPGATCPEPDLVAYRGFPLDVPWDDVRWEDVSPILVAEILSPDNADKDLVRNVELYWQVPSIREYWIVDGLNDPTHPHLTVYRRFGQRWRIKEIAAGETYTTRLLPGFQLLVNPRS